MAWQSLGGDSKVDQWVHKKSITIRILQVVMCLGVIGVGIANICYNVDSNIFVRWEETKKPQTYSEYEKRQMKDLPTTTEAVPEEKEWKYERACWDYSPIWGGGLCLIFALFNVRGAKHGCFAIFQGVLTALGFLLTTIVGVVATFWTFNIREQSWQADWKVRQASGENGYERNEHIEKKLIQANNLKDLDFITMLTIGTAVFAYSNTLLYILRFLLEECSGYTAAFCNILGGCCKRPQGTARPKVPTVNFHCRMGAMTCDCAQGGQPEPDTIPVVVSSNRDVPYRALQNEEETERAKPEENEA